MDTNHLYLLWVLKKLCYHRKHPLNAFHECNMCCKEGTEVENLSFDIVPSDLITGRITKEGILEPF